MNIAGYVRDFPGREDSDSAFAQSERIRRWALDTGNTVVAMCQDHAAADPSARPGYRALVDVARSGSADAIVLARLDALSSDVIMQEIMLADLRRLGVTVIATAAEDAAVLMTSDEDHARLVVRDVVAKLAVYQESYGVPGIDTPSVDPAPLSDAIADDDAQNVVIKLIAPDG